MTRFTKFQISRVWSTGLAALLGGLLALSGCKKDDSAAATPPAPTPNVQLASSATLGSFLADSVGNTLYFFALDVAGANTCTSATCNPMWPVYYGGPIKVPAGLDAKDFTAKKTTDGRSQTYYKGWPLYYFAPPTNGVYTREAANQTTGNGVGSVWHVMNPSYGVVLGRKGVEDKTTHVVTSKAYLVDGQGRTLYYFAKDNTASTTQATNCTGGCATVWPALYLGTPAVPSTLKASDFGTLTRDQSTSTGPYGTTTSTTQQLTYKGHPLYYFATDNATRGQVEGDHLSSYGDFWYVATP